MGRVIYKRGDGRLRRRVNPQTGVMETVYEDAPVEEVVSKPLPFREQLRDPQAVSQWLSAADRAATLTAPLAGLISRAADQGDMPDNVFELSFRPAPVLATPEDPMAAAAARRRTLEDRALEADIGEKQARTRAATADMMRAEAPQAPPAPQPMQQPKPPAQPATQPVTTSKPRIAAGAADIGTLEARALAAIQQGDARAAIQVLKDFDDSDGEGVYAESWGDLMTGAHKRRARQRLVGMIGRGLPSEADTRLMEAKIRAAEGLGFAREQSGAAAKELARMRGIKADKLPAYLAERLRRAKALGDTAEQDAIRAAWRAYAAQETLPDTVALAAEKVLSQRALTEQRKASAKASRASAWASGERARSTRQKRQFDKSMEALRRFKEEAQHEKANYEAGRAYQALQKATADVLARAKGGDMTPTAKAGIAKTLAGVEGELQEVDALLGLAVDPSAVGAKPEDLVISSDGKTLIKRERDVVGYTDVPDAPGTARAIAKRAGLLKQIEGLRAIVGDIGGGAEVKRRTPIEKKPAPVNADTLWD